MAMPSTRSYPSTAFLLTLVGGLLITLLSLYLAVIYSTAGVVVSAFFPGLGAILIAFAIISLLFGLVVLFAAYKMYTSPNSARSWGLLAIIGAVLSLFSGGGYFIGFLLALIGGILAMTWHPSVAVPSMGAQPLAPSDPMGGAPAAVPGGPKTCGSCGSANAAGARFCAKCGAALPA